MDPSIELVVCGSSNDKMSTMDRWEAEVLEHCFDHVEYLSLHQYYGNPGNDTPGFLARSEDMSDYIDEIVATCDYVSALKRSRKRIMPSSDEWNVWLHSKLAGDEFPPWGKATPFLEDVYTMEDALLAGSMVISLLNHADHVKGDCMAQLVNVIAPAMTCKGGPAWRQTISHPFADGMKHGGETVLRQVVDSPKYGAKTREGVPYLTSACVMNKEAGSLTVFAVNRSLGDSLELNVDLRSVRSIESVESTMLRHDDLKAENTAASPHKVSPCLVAHEAEFEDGRLKLALEPASWNVLNIRVTGAPA